MKTCTRCGIEKRLNEFSALKRGKFGVHTQCKSCRKNERRKRNGCRRTLVRGFNRYEIDGDHVRIFIEGTSRTGVVMVSLGDLPALVAFGKRWSIGKQGYVSTGGRTFYKSWRISLHRFLLGDSELSVDHVNGNKLDNRRCNLELVPIAENIRRCWEMRRSA